MHRNIKDMTGLKFGSLKVLKKSSVKNKKQ